MKEEGSVLMDANDIQYFKEKLLHEKSIIEDLMQQMKRNETINSKSGMENELSFYDNHPADGASEMFDRERGMALKGNEVTILKKIDDALKSIGDGSYGVCKTCGREITKERLEFIPYTVHCINCEEKLNSLKPPEKQDRPVEEDVLGKPFGYGYNDFDYNEDIEYDAEDTYQDATQYNKLKNVAEFYDADEEYVDKMDKISNNQYKAQLPD